MKIPKPLQFIMLAVVFYGLLKIPGLLLGNPIPQSVIFMYMLFIVITILLVMTSTDESAKELFSPIRALVEDPSKKFLRNIVFAAVPLLAGYAAYGFTDTGVEPPSGLRSVHPAPPEALKAYGKTFVLSALENPLRRLEKENPDGFRKLVEEGGEVYFRDCFFCHGSKLDGGGHYAHAMSPPPLSFKGSDTIAQLQESYLFWRIVKGGPGLPREAGPSESSMPAWEDKLAEDEVWKVVLFLYDYTGNRPRSWGK
ncbi:MAG: cytochrome c [Deltaproteobacteria bacterium]|nr:cytochrome c [Deltaproteobacteria bacterium]